jgi:hypothetical protein
MFGHKAQYLQVVRYLQSIAQSEPEGSIHRRIAKITLCVLTVIAWCILGYWLLGWF